MQFHINTCAASFAVTVRRLELSAQLLSPDTESGPDRRHEIPATKLPDRGPWVSAILDVSESYAL